MKDRIAHIMRAKNLKASDFASLLGIQPSAVSHILAGRNKPSLEIVRKIKETFPEYNLDWIIFGAGPVTTSEPFKEPSKGASTGASNESFMESSNENTMGSFNEKSNGTSNEKSMGTSNVSLSGASMEPPLNHSNLAPTSQNGRPSAPNVSPASQNTSFQASLFELETEEETGVVDTEKPENGLSRLESRFSSPSSGIRSIVIFYEDGTFESFLPR